MAFSAYPTGSDLTNYLAASGLVYTGADLTTTVAAGREDFEKLAGRRMLAPATSETRSYDPPTNRTRTLQFHDLVSLEPGAGAVVTATIANGQATGGTVTSGGGGYQTPTVDVSGGNPNLPATFTVSLAAGVVTALNVSQFGAGYVSPPQVNILSGVMYQPYNSSAQFLYPGQDYVMDPAYGPEVGLPYDRLTFISKRFPGPITGFLRNCIKITGRFGYGTTLSEDVFQAMLARAVWRMIPNAAQLFSAGVLSWGFGDDNEKNEVGFKSFADGQNAIYLETVKKYRKVLLA